MIYQCSDCGNEFEEEPEVAEFCPSCRADKSYFVAQPFNILSETEGHFDLDVDQQLED